nr:hypothetical protein [Tanacetum cinerariifolium]
MEGEDLAASTGLLSDCEATIRLIIWEVDLVSLKIIEVVASEVVVDKDDETLVLVFDEALGVRDAVFIQIVASLQVGCTFRSPKHGNTFSTNDHMKFIVFCEKVSLLIIYQQNYHSGYPPCLNLCCPLSGNKSVINPTSKDLKFRSVKVKNRRCTFMDKLMNGGKLFFEDSMRDREPYLHHEFVGKFQDQSGRHMYRLVEKWWVTRDEKKNKRNKKRRKIRMTRKWMKGSMVMPMCMRMNLVDLAGTERQKATGATRERQKEARHINRSLTQLGYANMFG